MRISDWSSDVCSSDLASAATLIDVIRDTGRDAGHLLISGHNPGLEDLILMLVPETAGDELPAKVEEKLPTSALARLHLDLAHSLPLDTDMARFEDLIRHRDPPPRLAPTPRHPSAQRDHAHTPQHTP